MRVSQPIHLSIALLLATLASAYAQSIAFNADVTSVAVDPRNPSRIYATTRGGLLKTDNRGATWDQLPIFPLGRRQPAFAQIEFDLNNTAIIFAPAYGYSSDRLVGVWRSSNRGADWQRIVEPGTFPTNSQFLRLLVAPTNASILYAVLRIGTFNYTYRSADAGLTWTRTGVGSPLSVSTGNPDTLYSSRGTAVLRSTDGGAAWAQLAQLTNASSLTSVNSIAASPADPNLLLAGVSGPGSGVGIYRSTSGGSSWNLVQPGGAIGLRFNVRNPSIVVLGDCCTLAGFYSNDGGFTFSNFSSILEGSTSRVNINIASASFDYSQMGALMVGLSSLSGGGVAAQSGPAGVWRRLPGTFTPTAIPQIFLESGQLLSGDSSEARSFVRIVAAEGGSASGFSLANPSVVTPGTSVRIVTNTPEANQAPQSVVVSRSALSLSPGIYNTSISIPVTGALNRELTFEGSMEVVNQPQSPGVSLPIRLPSTFNESILSLASAGGRIYLGTASRLYAWDGRGELQVLAGTGVTGFSGDGGPATRAQVSRVTQIAVAPDGTIAFHDSFNSRIRRLANNGTISTLAGNPAGASTITEGALLNSISFSSSSTRLALRANGELLVALGTRIWRVDGNAFRTVAGGGFGGIQDGALATAVSLSTGILLSVDPQNAIVFSDRDRIYRILPNNTLQWLAGAEINRDIPGSSIAKEVPLSIEALLAGPDGVYLFDSLTNTIQRVNPDGSIQHVALNGMSGEASACTGAIYAPRGTTLSVNLALAPDASLLVSDSSLRRFWIPSSTMAPGPAPLLTPEGIVNAASLSPALSPGTLASFFGANLATSQSSASALPLPADLAGAVSCLAGQVAPLAFASPSQLNAQIPFGLAPGTHSLRAFTLSGGTAAVPVNLQPTSPELFQANGRAVVINPDGSLNQPERGAAAGDVVVAYLTGLGAVTPAVATGTASPSSPLALPAAPSSATVGGSSAAILYLGFTPGFVGLAQANLRIPDLPPGDHDLVITVSSHASQALPVTVQ